MRSNERLCDPVTVAMPVAGRNYGNLPPGRPGAGDSLEVLLPEGMDVQPVTSAGRDEKIGPEQIAACVPGRLAVDDAVMQDRVVDLFSRSGHDPLPCSG